MIMGVVGDDLTGSNDIGIMFAKSGYVADVYAFDESDGLEMAKDAPDICILNTNSRLDSTGVTYAKVHAATLALQAAGCKQFFAKTSSAFVGPVGAQFDAMLDALSQEFAVVIVGFPKNGRTTIDGVHYVHGARLEDSEFRRDPAYPMTCSNLVEILQSQTRRKVGLINHELIELGADALHCALDELRPWVNYVVLDVVNQAMLQTIARAVADVPVLCGSSAVAEELPAVWAHSHPRLPAHAASAESVAPPRDDLGVLCVAGSLMPQTLEQIRHLRQQGAAAFELNSLALFDSRSRQAEVDRIVGSLECRLKNGQNVIVHSANEPEKVELTRAAGLANSLSATEVARLVSETLAEVVWATRRRCNLSRLLIAGGETSSAVCARLGLRAFRIREEIQPGLPSCLALGVAPLLLVLKSGSFGTPDFFEKAIAHLVAG